MYTLARIIEGDGPDGGGGLLACVAELLVAAQSAPRAVDQQNALERAQALVEAAEAVRRAESAPIERRPTVQPVRNLVDRVESRWRGAAAAAGAMVLVSYTGDPLAQAMVDLDRFDQFVDALVGHALAGRRGGAVEISLATRAADDGLAIELEVRDDRPGRDERYVSDLIAGAAPIAALGGIEIAVKLALARHLAAAIDGELHARPNAGPGATLTLVATLARAQAAPGVPAPDGAAHRGHVLIVDDNATNRMVVDALCEMFGWSAESACDGVEAVAAAAVGRFDAILMDIRMPRMDGLAATREIRRLPGPAGETPIVALTANADPDEVRGYLAAGMQGVVEKPVKPDRLLAALEGALQPNRSSGRAAA